GDRGCPTPSISARWYPCIERRFSTAGAPACADRRSSHKYHQDDAQQLYGVLGTRLFPGHRAAAAHALHQAAGSWRARSPNTANIPADFIASFSGWTRRVRDLIDLVETQPATCTRLD